MLALRHGKSVKTAFVVHCDLLPRQGIEPEVRTFNTVIIACNMSGQAAEALRVYERMLSVGAQPTATTYTALIRRAACRSVRHARGQALQLRLAGPAGSPLQLTAPQ